MSLRLTEWPYTERPSPLTISYLPHSLRSLSIPIPGPVSIPTKPIGRLRHNNMMCMTTENDLNLMRCDSPPLKIIPSRKMVRFGGVSERKAEEIHSLSEEQIESMWYTLEEKQDIRRQLRRVVKRSSDKASTRCLRGLEMQLDHGQRTGDMEDKLDYILDLQEYNLERGCKPSHGLDTLSLSLSRHDRQRAVLQAYDDAAEASRIYKETFDRRTVNKMFQAKKANKMLQVKKLFNGLCRSNAAA